jgi:hypothetical protein
VARNEEYSKLWLIKNSDLPVSNVTGALDFSAFHRGSANNTALPIIKLVDDFQSIYNVLFTDGDIFTIATNVNSMQIRCSVPEPLTLHLG